MPTEFRNNIKVSIVIPVYNSHGILRRQILYFYRLHLPESIEIIFMDDGSNPPLKPMAEGMRNINIFPTGDFRPWTQTAAKNLGVKIAEGEYVFITDVDHIITPEAIEAVLKFDGDKMVFPREFGIIDVRGRISQRKEDLLNYGMREIDYIRKGTKHYIHTNTFCMRKKVFIEIGGYPSRLAEMGIHDIYDDNYLHGRYRRQVKAGLCKPEVWGPTVLTFPGTVKDPKGLFHNLVRK